MSPPIDRNPPSAAAQVAEEAARTLFDPVEACLSALGEALRMQRHDEIGWRAEALADALQQAVAAHLADAGAAGQDALRWRRCGAALTRERTRLAQVQQGLERVLAPVLAELAPAAEADAAVYGADGRAGGQRRGAGSLYSA